MQRVAERVSPHQCQAGITLRKNELFEARRRVSYQLWIESLASFDR